MEGRLVVVSGRDAGKVFQLVEGKKFFVGRDKDCDICLSGRMISREHFSVLQDGEFFFINDLGSRNGTYINENKCSDHLLKNGDIIQVGPVHLRFDMSADLSRSSALPESESVELVSEEKGVNATTFFKKKFDLNDFSLGTNTEEIEKISNQQLEYKQLMLICSLSGKLFTTKSITKILGVALETAIELTGAERASAIFVESKTGELRSRSTRFCDEHYCGHFPISKTIVNETIRTGESVITGNASADSRFADGESVAIDNITSVMCVPLITLDAEVIGALYVDSTSGFEAFDKVHLSIFAAIAHQAAIAVERAKLFDDLEKMFIGSIHTLTASIEAKDEYTCGHSERVTCYSMLIAEELGLDSSTRDLVEFAGIMHDVGKIGIPESVLCSTGKLTHEQYEMMQTHPAKGADIILKMPEIAKFASIKKVAKAVRHHHERFDGSGYPDGLAGKEIPLVSQILAVADTFDAVTSDRSYRKGRDAKVAMKILSACSGIQVDPDIFAAFERVYSHGKINWLETVNVRFTLNVKRLRANTAFCSK